LPGSIALLATPNALLVAPVGAIVFVDTGGLIAYGPSYADLARRGASLAAFASRRGVIE
jgi:hypothetical protein